MESKTKNILEALKMQPLSEEEKASRHILGRLYGPIATTKEKTRNGRGYGKELWEKVLSDDIFKEKLATKSLLLELGHPLDREETDMKMVCACIPEMPKIVDGDIYAYVDILDTPNGKLLKTLCDYGFVPGISSRGSGDIMANDEVDPETFFLETWDIVALPAVKKARLAMCESLNHEKSLKAVLQESYIAASDKEKEVMKEALDNLKIEISESVIKEEDIPYEDPEVSDDILIEKDIPIVPEKTDSDDSSDEVEMEVGATIIEEKPAEFSTEEAKEVAKAVAEEVVKELDPVVPAAVAEETIETKVEEVVEEKVKEKAILPEETPVDNIEVSKVEEPVVVAVGQSVEAVDNGDTELLDSLKEMVRQKGLLESEIKELKSQKTVSDAEVKEIRESLNKYKDAYIRVSELASKATKFEKENKSLIESMAKKDAQIKELTEKVEKHTKLTESINAKEKTVTELTEKLHSAIAESEKTEKALKEEISEYRSKLIKRTETAKSYKAKYESVLEHYITSKAKLLNVRNTDITSRLAENYSIDDVDKVCDDLLTESLSWSNLPFGMSRGQAKMNIKESASATKYTDPDEGYEIDDDLLTLAGLK